MKTSEHSDIRADVESDDPALHPHCPELEAPSAGAHWDELHGEKNGGLCSMASRLKRRIENTPPDVIAAAALTGLAAGYLLARRRPSGLRAMLAGALWPSLAGGMHHAYDSVRSNKRLRDLGHRASNLTPW